MKSTKILTFAFSFSNRKKNSKKLKGILKPIVVKISGDIVRWDRNTFCVGAMCVIRTVLIILIIFIPSMKYIQQENNTRFKPVATNRSVFDNYQYHFHLLMWHMNSLSFFSQSVTSWIIYSSLVFKIFIGIFDSKTSI